MTLIVTSTSLRHLMRVNYVLCIVIMCILSRKHLSVPPGLGQRQQSLSLTFSVFFSAARSQVLPPFFFFFTHIFTTFTRPSKNPSLVFSMGPTYNCPSTTSGSSTTLQSNCPYLPPKSTKTISPTSTSSSVLALNSAISCAISSLDGSLWRWVSVAAQRQL